MGEGGFQVKKIARNSLTLELLILGFFPLSVKTDPLKIRHFSLGLHHTCVVLDSLAVACWGKGSEGELGKNTQISTTLPLLLSPVADFIKVFSGGKRTCVLKREGKPLCTGLNLRGELMTGSFGLYGSPRDLMPLSEGGKWRKIALRGLHSCALRQDGQIFCAGDNTYGQLGITTSVRFSPKPLPFPVPEGEEWEDVQVGYRFTCALTRSGSLYCSGDHHLGTLGIGSGPLVSPLPRKVPLPRSVRSFAAGGEHVCAIVSGGDLYCWGRNLEGQAGEDPRRSPFIREPFSYPYFPDPVSNVCAGSRHTCFLTDPQGQGLKSASYGNLFCFGSNRSGELGQPLSSRAYDYHAQPLSPELRFTMVGCGEKHTCALSKEGDLYCFGGNFYGESGASPLGGSAELTRIPPASLSGLLRGRGYEKRRRGGSAP